MTYQQVDRFVLVAAAQAATASLRLEQRVALELVTLCLMSLVVGRGGCLRRAGGSAPNLKADPGRAQGVRHQHTCAAEDLGIDAVVGTDLSVPFAVASTGLRGSMH